jgi:DnaJ-class molecular chaperone
MRNPYDILGLSRSAGPDDVKRAYRKLAKALPPDRNTDDPRAKDRFAELNGAYEILGDADKKAQFDRGEIDGEGKPRFRGFGGGARDAGGFEGFGFGRGEGAFGSGRRGRPGGAQDDIFSHIFGEAFSQAARGGSHEPRSAGRGVRGEDVEATLTVTLEEVATEARTRVELSTGREVEVVIPKGVTDGQVIRLRGLGEPGPVSPGDALLTIRFAPHERFVAEGANLRHRLSVDLDEAVLGGQVKVPTLTGAVQMAIPPMTSSGRTFRLRGKGLPGKTGPGDLLVSVEIRLPEEADEALLDYARRRRAAKVG